MSYRKNLYKTGEQNFKINSKIKNKVQSSLAKNMLNKLEMITTNNNKKISQTSVIFKKTKLYSIKVKKNRRQSLVRLCFEEIQL